MFIAARCASHFQFNTNSSHHYTNSLVAIAFYIEYCPSFLISVKKRARLIEHCRLKFFSVLNDQIAVPPGRNVPRLPLAISSGWLSNWVGLRTASASERNMVLAVNAVVISGVDVPEKRCKIPTLLQSSGSKVKANLTLPTIVPGFRYRYMGV